MMSSLIIITEHNANDIYLSVLKYHITNACPSLKMFEYCTGFSSQSIFKSAAYILINNHQFSDNTVFFIENNIAEKKQNQSILLVQYNNKWLLTPDNGIIGLIEKSFIQSVFRWKESITSTFYAKNEMLNALKDLVANDFKPTANFTKTEPDECTKIHWPSIKEQIKNNSIKQLVVPVMMIDSYGNLILHFKKKEFDEYLKNYNISIQIAFEKLNINSIYNDKSNADTIALFNDAGYLEIASNGNKLAPLVVHRDIYDGSNFYVLIELKPKQ